MLTFFTRPCATAAVATLLAATGVAAGPADAASAASVSASAVVHASVTAKRAVEGKSLPSYDAELVALVNDARTARGLTRLKVSTALRSQAIKWSSTISTRKRLSHDPRLARSAARAGCAEVRYWGENVAYTSGGPAKMFSLYMNSSAHRANILRRRFNTVGVGTVSAGGVNWNTMKFVQGRCN